MAQPTSRHGQPLERTIDADVHADAERVRLGYVVAATTAFAFVIFVIGRFTQPDGFPLAFTILVVSAVAAFIRPVVGVYLIVFLTLIGDTSTNAWWPFAKNMSSRESVLYLSDSVVINPLEVLLGVTFLAFFLHRLEDPNWRFHRGRLFVPVMVFAAFVFIGFARGILLGGDRRIAIFEARPLFYIPLVYILVTNLFTMRSQYQRLLLLAFFAVSVQSVFALLYYRRLPDEQRENLESLTEHSATIHMSALIVFLIALALLHCSRSTRWLMIVLAPPVIYAYLLSERRAAMVALIIGIMVLLVFVWQRHRRAFFVFTPIFAVIGLGLVLAGWNASGPLGLPAQAVKSVLGDDTQTAADRSSDLYRQIEAFDVWYTIRAEPLTGVGFGHQFYRPINLPDISFFEFWEYLPHHSMLWIWLKTGIFGFAAMLFLIGRAIQRGTRSAMQVGPSDQAATVIAGLTYVIMFIVFAYVDIAWDVRSTVFLAVALALCADFQHAADAPIAQPSSVPIRTMVPQ